MWIQLSAFIPQPFTELSSLSPIIMSNIVISVENLSKSYRLGQIGTGTFAHDLNVWWAKVRGKPNPLSKVDQTPSPVPGPPSAESDRIWALKDVSFTVEQGEVLGIIGRNGAGKSTLLKILSRVTAPTKGKIKIKGRVASLLEVGTGFHPELTGRENVYLNGSVLGMTRREITRKFDEIVDFAGVEKFIDTPVKRYSSGMHVRLAFAVAAHLDPEILVVDEVLAVGDAEFQKKCLGKMGEVASGGRTVLFVSHNMGAVTRLCRQGLWLDQGKLGEMGEVVRVVNNYLNSDIGISAERRWDDMYRAPGDDVARLKSIRVISQNRVTDTVDIRYPVSIEMEYWNNKADANLLSVFSFVNEQGQILFVSADFCKRPGNEKPKGIFRSRCNIPGNFFAEGRFSVVAEVSTGHPMYQIHFLEWDSVCFNVIDKGEPGSVRSDWGRTIPGLVRPQLDWQTEFVG
jgi:lipopolysaccharide transport system ATP-binding protein